jgi:6-pyruvoyltetrahydropterin/6-carboxytetrahydropterin synthase
MITIAKRFTFDAAHFLPCMPELHKCRGMHGHTYEVELRLHGEPDENGILVDYGDIATAWEPIFVQIDHKVLNDIPGLKMPSTEVLAVWLFDRFTEAPFAKHLASIKVAESSTTWAELTARSYAAHRGSRFWKELIGK